MSFYRERFASLRRALVTLHIPSDIAAWTPSTLRAVFEHFATAARTPAGQPLSPYTIHCTWRATKSLLRFCVQEGSLAASPLVGVSAPQLPHALPRILTVDEARALLQAPVRSRWTGLRDFALIAVAFDSGMRASELLGHRLADIDWENSSVKVGGKGSRERLIPLGRKARRIFTRWLKRRGELRGCAYAFPTRQGGPVSRRHFLQALRRYAVKAGLAGRPCHPHALRHTACTMMLQAGASLETVRRILGHSTYAMVERYSHLAIGDLQSAHALASPLDRLTEAVR